MKNEIWKQIEGFGRYSISNLGNIASNRILKAHIGNHGFKCITLLNNGVRKTFLIHRLVAKAFIDNPNNYLDVDHKNFDKLNNDVDNLCWTNDLINNRALFVSGRMKGNFISSGAIRCIETGIEFGSVKECCKVMGLPYASVWSCVNGKQSVVQGYKFEKC
jgi:hypothetical protein